MAGPSLNSTLVARLAQALYGVRLGQATMAEALAASAPNALGSVSNLANALYLNDFAGRPTSEVASIFVSNLGIDAAVVPVAETFVTNVLNATPVDQRGAALLTIAGLFATSNDPALQAAAAQFNADVANAVTYSQTFGTANIDLNGGVLNVDGSEAGVLRLTGNTVVRIDLTRQTDQIVGVDLNRNGVIEFNGRENVNPTSIDDGKNFTVVDAYARNPNNVNDIVNNQIGSIFFDGTGFAGNGTSTNGNIFLGGLNRDIALGGIGNDFLAGGGTRAFNNLPDGTSSGGQFAGDTLSGGRNADFMFVELALLSATDGNNNNYDGGNTADDIVAGIGSTRGLGTQDNDFLLVEASDDDEPTVVDLDSGGGAVGPATGGGVDPLGAMFTRAGAAVGTLRAVESVNASGNLYGFLNSFSAVVGARAYDGYKDGATIGTENYGRGSTAQLQIYGSDQNNALIGGYDNDQIDGAAGADLLMGGDLRFLITNRNNPNILDSKGGLNLTANAQGLVNDGKDNLIGGAGNDNIVFEADTGMITGDADTAKTSGAAPVAAAGPIAAHAADDRPYTGPRFQSQGDTVWLTDFSMGRLNGATLAGEGTAQADAMTKLSPDSTFRVDLGGAGNFRNYGGSVPSFVGKTEAENNSVQDGTNYVGAGRVFMTGMESVNTTGLGALDYKAAGSNTPELKFNNQQNYNGLQTNVDLRGNGVDNALLANTGIDTIEGRGGDDVVSGGSNNDRFLQSFGDGIDWNARPVDANGDNLWDTSGGLVVASGVAWSQDFRPAATATAGTTTLVVDLGNTVLNGIDTFLATFRVSVDGQSFGADIDIAQLAKSKSTTEVAQIVNASFNKQDPNVTVVATSANTIEVRAIDKTPGDGKLPVIGTDVDGGFFVTGQASGVGTFQAKGTILGTAGTNLEDDRLIIKTYESRPINLGLDQTKNEISQAAQMVANFTANGSTLSQGQAFRLYIDSVSEGDTITVDINGAKYAYTLKAGENAESAATNLASIVNTFLDINAASGTVAGTADLASFGDLTFDNAAANKAGVLITQTFVNNSATFMVVSATVTRADGTTPFGAVQVHNQSNTEFQMLGFDGRNGALFAQDKDASPVILFQGRQTGTKIADTSSVLLTAKNTGGVLNGTDANVDADDAAGGFINGDDLLFGGDNNDTIDAKTGDDRIMMSKGLDTVEGGGDSKRSNGTTQVYQDVLMAEERTFGTGTSFRVTLDTSLTGAGKGFIEAIKADGTPTGDKTTFSGIELVRTLENNRLSELNVAGLSDAIAAAAAGGPGGGILPAEGLTILLTKNPSSKFTVDLNNDGIITANETAIAATAVLGVESITTGAANDTVILDATQISANNKINLAGQQNNEVTLVEGADTVIYNHVDTNNDGIVNLSTADIVLVAAPGGGGLVTINGGAPVAGTVVGGVSGYTVVGGDAFALAGVAVGTFVPLGTYISDLAGRPTMTVGVNGQSSANIDMTKGVLGAAKTTDTLTGVEVTDVLLAATSNRFDDVLDVSALGGATVNYGAGEAVGKTLGGVSVAGTTVAEVEGDTLESGGVSLTGKNLGAELMEIVGITLLEVVNGSAGNDRVIVDNAMLQAGAATSIPAPAAGKENVAANSVWFTAAVHKALGAAGAGDVKVSVEDFGLFAFNLAGGDDTLDYKQETSSVTVRVDTSGTTDNDLIYVGVPGAIERADKASGVERYFGGSSNNYIDVTASASDTTLQFSKEARSNNPANDKAEPSGNDGAVATGETRSAELRITGTATPLALFMDRTGASDIGVAASAWNFVMGSNTKAETILFTDNEIGVAHKMFVAGGKNIVDYTAMTNNVTAAIGSVSRTAVLGDTFMRQTTNVTGSGGDVIEQAINLDNAANFLTINGTQVAGDTVAMGALLTTVVAPGTAGTPANRATLSSANDTAVLARHVGNLTLGEIREDIHGQFADFNNVIRPTNFLTAVSGFENLDATGSAKAVSLIGNGGVNGLTGSANADLLMGLRGTAPIGSATTGDQLTGAGGADWFVYTDETDSPGGSVTGNQQAASVFGAAPGGDAAVTRSQDTITDFVPNTDDIVIVIGSDTWSSVKVTTAIPANLAAQVGAVTAAVTPEAGAANSATITLTVDPAAAALSAREQNYFINTPGVTPTDADLIFRVVTTSGADILDAALGQSTKNLNAAADDGLEVHFVYTDKNQSQGGGFDQILNFTSGQDKIDLSFLRAPEWEARFGTGFDVNGDNVSDAIQGIRTVPGLPVAINADLPGLFMDAGGALRAVAVQSQLDAQNDPSTAIFVDVNHDGNYTVGADMVISLVGRAAPALGDFIFDRYDMLGINNEQPAFPANQEPGT